jgi:hypothetical protein
MRQPQTFTITYDVLGREIATSNGDRNFYDSSGHRIIVSVWSRDSNRYFYGTDGLIDSEQYFKYQSGGWSYFGGRRYVRDTLLHRDSEFFWFSERGRFHSQVTVRDSVSRESRTFNLQGAPDTTLTKYDDKWRAIDIWNGDEHWSYEYPVDTDFHTIKLQYLDGVIVNRDEEEYRQ